MEREVYQTHRVTSCMSARVSPANVNLQDCNYIIQEMHTNWLYGVELLLLRRNCEIYEMYQIQTKRTHNLWHNSEDFCV